jgi:hypothetical protein
VIVKGGSRSNGAFFARHLMRADTNERVAVIEMRGMVAQTVPEAFREMEAMARGTRTTKPFYHASMNPDPGETLTLTPDQWMQAVDMLERELGLTDQPRFVVEHLKEGRTHRHVVFSRIDADTMTALPDGLNYRAHERAARAIEQAFGHPVVPSVLVPAKVRGTARPPRRPKDWEGFRAQETDIDPDAMKAEVTSLWHAADSGSAFAAALAAHGYILAAGDRRDLVLVDRAAGVHSLARRIAGAKAAEIRARLVAIDQAALPSVDEARALARKRADNSGGETPPEDPRKTPARDLAGVSVRPVVRDAATADAQLRQVVAQMTAGRKPPPMRAYRQPRFERPMNAAEAERQVRLMVQPLAEAIVHLGELPAIVGTMVDDGLTWFQRAAQQVHELVEEASETVRSWRDQVLGKRQVHNPDDHLDLD